VKESSENERRTYEALNGSSLGEFAPRCFRSVDRGKKTLLYIEDLTAPYASPCVMDIKMGTRTFQEKEGDNPNRRLDLMQKMAKMDNGPQDLTADEREQGITKLRYMQFRDSSSSSADHGWRIEGIHLPGGKYSVRKTLRESAALRETLCAYLQDAPEKGRPRQLRAPLVAGELAGTLDRLREALQASAWFHQHEVVSSSLLLIYDDAEPPRAPPGVWMIDFANCLGHDVRLSHRAPWAQGNHEDGYLAGLDSLVDMFTSISRGGQAAHGDAHGRTDAD